MIQPRDPTSIIFLDGAPVCYPAMAASQQCGEARDDRTTPVTVTETVGRTSRASLARVPTGGLPVTGGDIIGLAIVGIVPLMLGALLARRRHASDAVARETSALTGPRSDIERRSQASRKGARTRKTMVAQRRASETGKALDA